MKVFVKYYWMAKGKIIVNQWCDIIENKGYGFYTIISGMSKGMSIVRNSFLTIGDIRKQKLERICLK